MISVEEVSKAVAVRKQACHWFDSAFGFIKVADAHSGGGITWEEHKHGSGKQTFEFLGQTITWGVAVRKKGDTYIFTLQSLRLAATGKLDDPRDFALVDKHGNVFFDRDMTGPAVLCNNPVDAQKILLALLTPYMPLPWASGPAHPAAAPAPTPSPPPR